jgi:hypothetical protein
MIESELLACGLDLWLMGHTHIPYPSLPGPTSRVFYPGTPEPDGFDCQHEGKGLVIEIDGEKQIKPDFVRTGTYRFYHEDIEISSFKDAERLLAEYSQPQHRNTLLKLHMKGRLPEEEYERLRSFHDELAASLCFFQFDASEVMIKITPEVIEREFTEGSFPYRLLKGLAESHDFEALQVAYELIRETQR